jgi:acetyl-CoA C-acetyltransferase
MTASRKGFFNAFKDVWMLDGVRTPMVDYCGSLGHISPTDLGIKAARAVLARAGVPGEHIGTVITGNMAPGDYEQFMLPRHISLYAGVPQAVPALMTQRICGTGFELFRQAGEQIESGCADVALLTGAESMTRNPIAAFTHRTGFKLGAPVEFKDFLWEALNDSAAGITMIQTAENLAKKYGITREEVDAFASSSFAKAVAAQQAGFHAGEIVPVVTETFELPGYAPAASSCRASSSKSRRTRTPASLPSKSWPSCAACTRAAYRPAATARRWSMQPRPPWWPRAPMPAPKARSRWPVWWPQPWWAWRRRSWASARPPAIQLLLERAGLKLDDIGRFEINEAQGAQTLAVGRELGLDLDKLNVNGGAIALGHPLAATGVRLTITLARELRRAGLRYGVSSACIGGGQGIALLLENPDAA